jgi:hypothetical protein
MTSIRNNRPSDVSAVVQSELLGAMHDIEGELYDLAQDVKSRRADKSKINEMKQAVRNKDMAKLTQLLNDNPQLKELVGALPEPGEKVIDRARRVTVDIPVLGRTDVTDMPGSENFPTARVTSERSHMEYSDEQFDGIGDRLNDVGEELSSLMQEDGLKAQGADQRRLQLMSLAAGVLKNSHDQAMASINKIG